MKKITIKNNVRILEHNEDIYVYKKRKKDLDNTYNYLLSRSFDYFPKKINKNNEFDIYEYISDIKEPIEQKALDLMYVLSLLHSKTTFYKEIDIEDYKKIYEETIIEIEDLTTYYNMLIEEINKEVYMSPSNYLIARNITKIYSSLYYAKQTIEDWYNIIKDKKKIRYVTLHNNLKIDHYIKKDKPYLVSWDKTKEGIPIYDLLKFYKNHYLDFDFKELLTTYESRYQLLLEEKLLLFCKMALPYKISKCDQEIERCKIIRKLFDYIYKTEALVTEYNPPKKTNENRI